MLSVSLFLLGCNEDIPVVNVLSDDALSRSMPCPQMVDEQIINCVETTNSGISACTEPVCGPFDGNCPPRTDLDPCDYSDMEEYAVAICCELNRHINNCSLPTNNPECTYYNVCVGGLISPPAYLALPGYENTNPFRFCNASTCTETIYCYYTPTLFWTIHPYLNIAAQDAIMHYAWCIANDIKFKPECIGSLVYPVAIYFKVCWPTVPYNCGVTGTCSNLKIKLHIVYECC